MSGIKGKKRMTAFMCVLLAAVSVFTSSAPSEAAADANADSGRIKIGYCQAGEYYEFDYQIYQIGMALSESGELTSEKLMSMEQGVSAYDVWDALCGGQSEFYEFDSDSFFDITANEFADLTEDETGERLSALISANQIDLMITMGTSAGLAVMKSCDVPYMNFIASDPVSSGITGGEEYSLNPRGWAHVNSGVEQKALDVMNGMFPSKKLGIVYSAEDPEAYIYSGAASVDEFAEANGKEVITEYVTDEFGDTEEEYQNYFTELYNAHKRLADAGIDIYILTTSYIRLEDFYDVLLPFMEKGIPVFSINSTEDVRCGALAAVEMINYQNIGRFAADTLNRYRNGAALDTLPQEYATSPFPVINADTMRRTGIKLPLDMLVSAGRIYGKYVTVQRSA